MVAPLPHGHFRVVATVENAPEKPDARADRDDHEHARPEEPARSAVGDVYVELACSGCITASPRAYRKGNIFLMGDAAPCAQPGRRAGHEYGPGRCRGARTAAGRRAEGRAGRSAISTVTRHCVARRRRRCWLWPTG